MKPVRNLILGLVLLAPVLVHAAEMNCTGTGNIEQFRYSWRLRGGLGWIAGLVFPRSGYGDLKTTFPKAGESVPISSELVITPADGKSGFYMYESQMDTSGDRTLMTYHGYSWGNKSRKERTIFDYVKRLARIHKETPKGIEDRVKLLPPAVPEMRDILTAIYYLRQHAAEITEPMTTTIYSDGKDYPVMFRPAGRQAFTIEGQRVGAVGFEIVDAPGGKRWPGGVRVWVSDDARRIPFRIEIVESLAALQLDLQSIESCASMQARN